MGLHNFPPFYFLHTFFPLRDPSVRRFFSLGQLNGKVEFRLGKVLAVPRLTKNERMPYVFSALKNRSLGTVGSLSFCLLMGLAFSSFVFSNKRVEISIFFFMVFPERV